MILEIKCLRFFNSSTSLFSHIKYTVSFFCCLGYRPAFERYLRIFFPLFCKICMHGAELSDRIFEITLARVAFELPAPSSCDFQTVAQFITDFRLANANKYMFYFTTRIC